MSDPAGLPTTLATSYPTTTAGSVGYMMMSYPGRPMVPMQPTVGMPYMSIGATATPQLMPTIMPMASIMGTTPGMVTNAPIQQQYRNQRNRKLNASHKSQLIVRQPSPATISAPPNTINIAANVSDIPKGPPVTVFVGNITEKAPDLMIRHILATCGHVVSWKRVQGFGFCEFGNPDAALRAMRLLHDMEIGSRNLVVKVDEKAKAVLADYKNQKKSKKKSDKEDHSSNDAALDDDDDYLDNDLKAVDENAKKRIADIIQEHHDQMLKYNPPNTDEDKPKTGAEVTEERVQQTHQRLMQLTKSSTASNNLNMKIDLDTVDYAEDGKRDLISREIGKFREIMKKQEEEKELERKKREEREKEREKYRSVRSPSANGRRSQSYQSISSTRSVSPEVRSPKHPQRSRMRSRSRDRDRDRGVRNRDRSRDRERDRSRERDRERERDRDKERDRDRDRDRDRVRERDRDRDRDRERDRDHDTADVDRDRDRDRDRGDRVRDRSRDRERSPRMKVDRPDKDLLREKEEEEELKEQRKRERATKEREASYQEKLKSWETREKYKSREAAKEKEKRRIKEEERQKEAKRLKEFLEDYDDERDDSKYYKGRELQRRLTEREIEVDMDNRDRQKEKEELEELKAKIYSGETINPEYEYAKLLKAREEMYKPKLLIDVAEEHQRKEKLHERELDKEKQREREREKEEWQREQKRVVAQRFEESSRFKPIELTRKELEVDSNHLLEEEEEEEKVVKKGGFNRSLSNSPAPIEQPDSRSPSPSASPTAPATSQRSQSGDKNDDLSDASDRDKKKRRKLDVKDVFNNDDDDTPTTTKRRKLVPLDYNDDKKSKEKENKAETPKSQEEKRKHIKTLIDTIPTEKALLFEYELDWSSVDNNLMEKRIRPWINKKIIEYIGEPEPTLVDFICSKVLAGSDPQSILNDVQMVLDEEAEVFVVKMWRLLIYEVEAKKLGLMK